MLLTMLRRLYRQVRQLWTTAQPAVRTAPALAEPATQPLVVPAATPAQPRNHWPAGRLAVTDQLWGRGFSLAGGSLELLQLIRPLGLSSASSLLLLGGGGGGPATCVVANTGAWVNSFEVEPALLTQAKSVVKSTDYGGKIKIESWDPQAPVFPRAQHHHAVVIEPLRYGGTPEPLIDALSRTVKPGGQLVIVGLVADPPLLATDPVAARWAKLEGRDLADLPSQIAITRTMGRLGFDVRVVEDLSMRHVQNVMIGWRTLLRRMGNEKPTNLAAAFLVGEAETWLLRVRLLRQKQMQMVRWHVIATGPVG